MRFAGKIWILSALALLIQLTAASQNTSVRISGNVRDANGNALPYTTVRISGSTNGCITDNNGNFSFNGNVGGQTLTVSSIGYKDFQMKLSAATRFPISIILEQATYSIDEVVINPQKERYRRKNNPAVTLMQEIIGRKDSCNPFNADYLSRKRYEHLVLALDNFTEEKAQQPPYRKFPFLSEYTDTSLISGKPILNVSTREIAATDYYQHKPSRKKQRISGREWSGVEEFMPDEEIRASLDATLSDIDLFNEKVMIMRKEFVSPFAGYATSYYEYFIMDTIDVDGEKCIDLSFVPRNSQSLGFTGHIYVTPDSTHFVKWIQMSLPVDINLNFVEYMNIEQKFTRDGNHPRLLTYEGITAEFKLFDFIDGLYGHREVYYSDYRFDDDVDREPFTHEELVMEDADATTRDELFWAEYRGNKSGSLISVKPIGVEEMMARLRQIPIYYWTEKAIDALFSGYIPVRKDNTPFYFGPLNTLVSHNGMENVRFKIGGMSTAHMNPHLFGTGYLIYGLDDERMKYFGRLEYSFKPKKEQWNEFPIRSLRLQYENDIYQYGQQYKFTNKDNALLSIRRLPDNMIGYVRNTELTYTNERYSGLTFTAIMRNRVNEATRFIPMERNDGSGSTADEITQTELELGIRYAPNEKFAQHKWDRTSKTPEHPVFELSHTMSRAGLLGSDYSIQHTEFAYQQRLMAAPVGYFDVVMRAGKIWGQTPYPLLIIPNANLSYTYRRGSFETLTPMEFVFDRHLSWDVTYHMNGLILNRIPLVNRMKLREELFFRGIWGALDDRNNPNVDTSGRIFMFPTDYSKATATPMTSVPFIEIGAGLTNIFRLMSVSWFQRLTYTDTPDVDLFGIRIAVEMQY